MALSDGSILVLGFAPLDPDGLHARIDDAGSAHTRVARKRLNGVTAIRLNVENVRVLEPSQPVELSGAHAFPSSLAIQANTHDGRQIVVLSKLATRVKGSTVPDEQIVNKLVRKYVIRALLRKTSQQKNTHNPPKLDLTFIHEYGPFSKPSPIADPAKRSRP